MKGYALDWACRKKSKISFAIAASIFRAGAPMAQVIGVLFLAKLYGVVLHPVQLATIVVTVVATSLTVPGIPGGSIIVMAPVLASANIRLRESVCYSQLMPFPTCSAPQQTSPDGCLSPAYWAVGYRDSEAGSPSYNRRSWINNHSSCPPRI